MVNKANIAAIANQGFPFITFNRNLCRLLYILKPPQFLEIALARLDIPAIDEKPGTKPQLQQIARVPLPINVRGTYSTTFCDAP